MRKKDSYQSIFSVGTEDTQLILLISTIDERGAYGAYYKYFASGHAYEIHQELQSNTKIEIKNSKVYYNSVQVGISNYIGAVDTSLYLFVRANLTSYATAKMGKVIITNNGILN